MRTRSSWSPLLAIALATLTAASASAQPAAGKLVPDDLPGPPPEVAPHPAIELPAIPSFALPPSAPGSINARALRVASKRKLGTEVAVRGYVTWIYDCAAALAAGNPKATRAQILAAIDKDPALCERPKLYLGATPTTPRDAAIWVVELPRAPTAAERRKLSAAELAARPPVPKVALGDEVVVTGTWTIRAPSGDANTDGLLVYKSLARAPAAAPTAPAAAPPAPPPAAQIDVATKPPLRRPVAEAVRNTSVGHYNTCNQAITARQYDAAIAACERATAAWPDNHLAWYSRASAHMARGEWPQAVAATERTVALRPDLAMYQLYHGVALYEAEVERARAEQARREGRPPAEVVLDPSTLRLDPARDALVRATRLDPQLWRAHFYLGRVYRELDESKAAAAQFTETIATHPTYRFAYIALVELYRRWDYADEALAVALAGTRQITGPEAAELWFEAGQAYDAKHADEPAIDAFTRALAAKPDDAASLFQRGQIHARRGDAARARPDLEAVTKSGDPRVAQLRPIAARLLLQLAAKAK